MKSGYFSCFKEISLIRSSIFFHDRRQWQRLSHRTSHDASLYDKTASSVLAGLISWIVTWLVLPLRVSNEIRAHHNYFSTDKYSSLYGWFKPHLYELFAKMLMPLAHFSCVQIQIIWVEFLKILGRTNQQGYNSVSGQRNILEAKVMKTNFILTRLQLIRVPEKELLPSVRLQCLHRDLHGIGIFFICLLKLKTSLNREDIDGYFVP